MKKYFLFVLCLLLIFSFDVLGAGIQHSTSASDVSNSDCNWSGFGANIHHTFSVSNDCAPNYLAMKRLWKVESKGGIGDFYESNGFFVHKNAKEIVCLNSIDGLVVWKNEGYTFKNISLTNDKCVATVSDDMSDSVKVICFELSTGQILWESKLSDRYVSSFPGISINEDKVVFYLGYMSSDYAGEDWKMKILALDDGEILFDSEIKGHSIPCLFYNDCLINSVESGKWQNYYTPRTISAINLTTFEEEWSLDAKDGYGFCNIPMIYEDKLYSISAKSDDEISGDSKFNCVDPIKGELLWSIDVPNDIWQLCSISPSGIAILANNEYLFGFDIASREQLWKIQNKKTFYNVCSTESVFYTFDSNVISETYIKCFDLRTGILFKEFDMEKKSPKKMITSNNKLFYGVQSVIKMEIICLGDNSGTSGSGLTVSPSSVIINFDQTYKFKTITEKTVTWSVDPQEAGTISSEGLFTPSGNESKCTIKAECEGKTAFAQVTIVFAKEIEVEPQNVKLKPGESVKFMAKILDRNGVGIIGIPRNWSVSNPEIGEISPPGEFTASDTPGAKGEVIFSFANLIGSANIEIIDDSKSDVIVFVDDILDFGKVGIDDECIHMCAAIQNTCGQQVDVRLSSTSPWIHLPIEEILIPGNSEEFFMVEIRKEMLKPGYSYSGKIKASWDSWSTDVQVKVGVAE